MKGIFSHRFDSDAKAAFGSLRRWDEISWALTADLCGDPYLIDLIPGTEIRAVRIADTGYAVFYRINEADESVEFLSVF